jgi:serine/threonine protein kinase
VTTTKKLPGKIGSYTILDRLGEGGMGEVFLGEHDVLGRKVAIKRLLPEMTENQEMAERFIREGKALAGLSHQGVCAVHDLFTAKGNLTMVLEYVDGFDLSHILKNNPLPIDVAAIVGAKLALALEHAHFKGIIHRDIKPANVMLSRRGDVKLMDFGIALATDLDRVTRTGLMVGTPMYMAPEVIGGGDPDARSDIYALGAMLYQTVSGRKIFAHANKDNLYVLIEQGRFPPLRKVAPHVPRALRRIITRCLEKKPERRYQSAADLREALDTFLSSHHAWSSHEERLVAFLHADGHLSEAEALTCIDAEDLVLSRSITLHPPRPWRSAIAIAAAAALASTLAYGSAAGWFRDLTSRLSPSTTEGAGR